MKAQIYKNCDKAFSLMADVLNDYCKSKILQDYFLCLFSSFFYGTLINNFFLNLNRKNIKDYNLPKGNIWKIKEKYKKIHKEARLAISLSLKNKNINEKYYGNFKAKIKKDFPEYFKIITDIEKEINITKTIDYLKKKENEIKELGKPDTDLNTYYMTKAIESYVQTQKCFPSREKTEKLMKVVAKECLPEFSKVLVNDLKKDHKEMLDYQRIPQKEFENRLYKRWKEPLDLLECLILILWESAEKLKNKIAKLVNNSNNLKHSAILKIHARALQISNEILVLLKSGYSDGANARWRSLHELAVISFFLLENNNDVSKRYLEHEVIRNFKEATDYRTYFKKLGYLPIDRKVFNKLRRKKESLCEKYIDNFQKDYGWIPRSIISAQNFRALEKHVKLDKLRPFYNLASDAVHGGAKGFYRLGLMDYEQNKIFLKGASNYGLADPIQNTAISLLHVTMCLLMLEVDFESLIQMYVMKIYVNEIGQKSAEVQRKMEKEESKVS